MSRIESTTSYTLAFAGILLTATLGVPAVAHAQSIGGEQSLLNRIAPTVGRYQGFVMPLGVATSAESANHIDGARAMGGTAGTRRQPPAAGSDTVAWPETRINGEQALLGRVAPVKSRQEGGE